MRRAQLLGSWRMEIKETPLALTFADVSLVPQRSRVKSRADVDTSSLFSRNVVLKVPVVSANMDTVTTAPMAIAMARVGGLGVIHRFLSVEEQVREVVRVKRSSHYKIDSPYTIGPDATLAEARRMTQEHGVSGLLVVEPASGLFERGRAGEYEPSDKRLVGILTSRDLRAAASEEDAVSNWMTPADRLVVAPVGVDLDQAEEQMLARRIEKLPIVDDAGLLAGLYTLKDVQLRDQFPLATRDEQGRLRVAAAIGVRGDYLERAAALVGAGADALVLDIAHGHSEEALRVVSEIKAAHPETDLVAGNVATAEGVLDLAAAGADAVKLGVGPGSVCETRVVAGVGVPQFSVVQECAVAAHELELPLIADGGIREPGDVAKAIGAGAATVMVGSLLAGCDEAPGQVLRKRGKKYKVFRGMASYGAAASKLALEGRAEEVEQYVPEGTEVEFELKGAATDVVRDLAGGLRSGMSYSNSLTIGEYWGRALFVRQTQAGRDEGKPHALDR